MQVHHLDALALLVELHPWVTAANELVLLLPLHAVGNDVDRGDQRGLVAAFVSVNDRDRLVLASGHFAAIATAEVTMLTKKSFSRSCKEAGVVLRWWRLSMMGGDECDDGDDGKCGDDAHRYPGSAAGDADVGNALSREGNGGDDGDIDEHDEGLGILGGVDANCGEGDGD